jgi:hypothetical protein
MESWPRWRSRRSGGGRTWCCRIHDNPGAPGGIYLDEGSGFIEVTGNVVYNVTKPMNYNNRNQNRIATCKEHDNWFKDAPDSSPEVEKVIEKAGLTPEYRDLLEK